MVVVSNSPEWVRLVNRTGDLPVLEKIHQAHEHRLHFVVLATMDRLVMGSMITVLG